MELDQINYIIEVLDQGRIRFDYFKDYYAAYLLERFVGAEAKSIQEVRASRFAKLLHRPAIKNQLGHWGDGKVTTERLRLTYPEANLPFRISFASWGCKKKGDWRYFQTSRRGFNLVLQLNFNGLHNKAYENLVNGKTHHPFDVDDHPSLTDREYTMAWVRIDLSDDFSYALVEEIQTDWLRYAKKEIITTYVPKLDENNKISLKKKVYSRNGLDIEDYNEYMAECLASFIPIWEEATLTAAIWFLWEEIGVDKIYYHSYETGCRLKDCQPPRSLYTKLPKKFCFEETEECPEFLQSRVKRYPKPAFFLLETP